MKKILILSLLIAQSLWAQNLILNSTFDNNVNDWFTNAGTTSTTILHNSDGNINNGSLQVNTTLNNGGASLALSDLMAVTPNTDYRVALAIKPLTSSEATGAMVSVYWFSPDTTYLSYSQLLILNDTNGQLGVWNNRSIDIISPNDVGFVMLLVGPLTVSSGSTNASIALFDDIYFVENDDLFMDGFE